MTQEPEAKGFRDAIGNKLHGILAAYDNLYHNFPEGEERDREIARHFIRLFNSNTTRVLIGMFSELAEGGITDTDEYTRLAQITARFAVSLPGQDRRYIETGVIDPIWVLATMGVMAGTLRQDEISGLPYVSEIDQE